MAQNGLGFAMSDASASTGGQIPRPHRHLVAQAKDIGGIFEILIVKGV